MEDEVKNCKNCKKDIAAVNFVVHSAFCDRQIHLCTRCDEPVQRNCLEQHHENFHAIINCCHCDARIEKWSLNRHMSECSRRPAACQFCDIEKPFDELLEHENVCGARTDKCSMCQQFILLRNFKKHEEICKEGAFSARSASCKFCGNEKPFDKLSEHMEVCGTRTNKCPRCSQFVLLKDFENHKAFCERVASSLRPASCKFCGDKKPFSKLSEHMEVCGARTSKCSICKQFVLLRDSESHKELCRKQQDYFENSSSFARHKDIVKDASFSAVCNEGIVNENGATSKQVISKNTSNYLGLCQVCKKNIPWVDMNTHIPTCATFNNKCSRCYKTVTTEDLKEHMLRLCPALKSNKSGPQMAEMSSNKSKKDSKIEIPKETLSEHCPYCYDVFSSLRIENHIQYCSQRKIECKFCKLLIHISNEENHLRNCVVQNPELHRKELYGSSRSHNEPFRDGKTKSRRVKHTEQFEGKHTEHLEGKQIPQETLSEHCPYCYDVFSSLRIENHIQYCSQRKKECKFCKLLIHISNEENHLKNCVVQNPELHRKELYGSSRSHDEAFRDEKTKSRQVKHTEQFEGKHTEQFEGKRAEHLEGKQQNSSSCCSASPCRESLIPCHFCGKSIPLCEEKNHLSVCAFQDNDKSYKSNRSAHNVLAKNEVKNGGAISKKWKAINKIESVPVRCEYCNAFFNAVAEPNHIEECIQNLGECSLCKSPVALKAFEKHLKSDCYVYKEEEEKRSYGGSKKKGKNNKLNKNSTMPEKLSNIWTFFKKFSEGSKVFSEFDATMETLNDYNADFKSASIDETSVFETKLPCEFCEQLFPMYSLVEHQSGCRPDLIHFPPNHGAQDTTKASDVSSVNLQQENSFSARKEFSSTPEKYDSENRYSRNTASRFDTEIAPGAFLDTYCFEPGFHPDLIQYASNPSMQSTAKASDLYAANLRSKNLLSADKVSTVIEKTPQKVDRKLNRDSVSQIETVTAPGSFLKGVVSKGSKSDEESKKEDCVFSYTATNRSKNVKKYQNSDNFVEPTKEFSIDCNTCENSVLDLQSLPPNPMVTDINMKMKNVVENKLNSSHGNDISDENKSNKFNHETEIYDVSSSEESVDGENIDAYLQFLAKKVEVVDGKNDEIDEPSQILCSEQNSFASCGIVSRVQERKHSSEFKINADQISGGHDVNVDAYEKNLLLSDDELEDKYLISTKNVLDEEKKPTRKFLVEINWLRHILGSLLCMIIYFLISFHVESQE